MLIFLNPEQKGRDEEEVTVSVCRFLCIPVVSRVSPLHGKYLSGCWHHLSYDCNDRHCCPGEASGTLAEGKTLPFCAPIPPHQTAVRERTGD